MNPKILGQFAANGTCERIEPWGNGHINDTWRVTFVHAGRPRQVVLQRLNRTVFPQADAVMQNFSVITRAIGRQLAADGAADADRRVLQLVSTRDGADCYFDANGDCWRMTHYIANTMAYDLVTADWQLREAGRAFGRFQQQLANVSPDQLVETIPNFHHTRKRYDRLLAAIAADRCGRAAAAVDAIDFVTARESLVDRLLDLHESGQMPLRVTHNDTKINNLLFDANSGEALCVTDLDTTMQGLALYDFGDLVRTTVSTSAEDTLDLASVYADPARFQPVVWGYLDTAAPFLNAAERANLVVAPQLMTYELALRFLTDHLEGDRYFKVHRPNHNLDRTRSQLALVASLEANKAQFEAMVAQHQAIPV